MDTSLFHFWNHTEIIFVPAVKKKPVTLIFVLQLKVFKAISKKTYKQTNKQNKKIEKLTFWDFF
jgi:hypothetical protein